MEKPKCYSLEYNEYKYKCKICSWAKACKFDTKKTRDE